MNLLKKISGSFLLGLAVIGLAVGTSAFTDKVNNEKLAGEIYVNNSSGEYELLPASEPYDSENCQNDNQQTCSWVRTDADGEVPEEFTSAQADSLEQEGLIEKLANTNGVYIP